MEGSDVFEEVIVCEMFAVDKLFRSIWLFELEFIIALERTWSRKQVFPTPDSPTMIILWASPLSGGVERTTLLWSSIVYISI